MAKRLPPGIGEDLAKPLLYNKYQQKFQRDRRLRFCLNCRTIGSMDNESRFVCPTCHMPHTTNLTAPRVFRRFLILAGRRGGKTLVGAHAAREEIMIPNSLGWVMGPTFKVLHDSTFPTLVRLLPPQWVKNWDAEHMEIDFVNGAKIAFRSLEDPERARGPGPDWGWFDEAALIAPRAWDVFRPSLSEKAGIAFFTTTVAGFDWTYKRFEIPALRDHKDHKPGFWACRFKTIDNPKFSLDPVLRAEIEEARQTMPPQLFAQEYEAERANFEGAVYDSVLIDKQTLKTDDAVRVLIPEWPDIDPSRNVIIGLDSGADHPFGAVQMVITPRGIVIVGEYLKRMQAVSQQLGPIKFAFRTEKWPSTLVRWAGNRNETNMILEFALQGVGVVRADNSHLVGIQRVQTWLYSRQLWFVQSRVPTTIAQMKAYHYAKNEKPDGEKTEQEKVYKLDDELPDGIRYGLMSWPELPKLLDQMDDRTAARMAAFDQKTQSELAIMKDYNKAQAGKQQDLEPIAEGYPIGDFFGGGEGNADFGGGFW